MIIIIIINTQRGKQSNLARLISAHRIFYQKSLLDLLKIFPNDLLIWYNMAIQWITTSGRSDENSGKS